MSLSHSTRFILSTEFQVGSAQNNIAENPQDKRDHFSDREDSNPLRRQLRRQSYLRSPLDRAEGADNQAAVPDDPGSRWDFCAPVHPNLVEPTPRPVFRGFDI